MRPPLTPAAALEAAESAYYIPELLRLSRLMDRAAAAGLYGIRLAYQRQYNDVVQCRDQQRRQANPAAYEASCAAEEAHAAASYDSLAA